MYCPSRQLAVAEQPHLLAVLADLRCRIEILVVESPLVLRVEVLQPEMCDIDVRLLEAQRLHRVSVSVLVLVTEKCL